MKNFYYFFYGFISALFTFMLFFNNTMHEYLDNYYIELLSKQYGNALNYTNFLIIFLFVICCIIWIYMQGVSAAADIAKQIKEEEEFHERNNKETKIKTEYHE